MNKSVATVLIVLIIVVFGGLLAVLTVRQQEPEPEPSPSPTSVVVGSFDLEGTITAASTAGAVSPTAGARSVDSGVTGTIDIRIDEIRGDFGGCVFEAGEVAVVRILDATVFEPATLISSPSFPDNLTGKKFKATGQVQQDPDDKCHLIADRVEDVDGDGGKGGSRESPSARVTETPGMKETETPTPRATASPSP